MYVGQLLCWDKCVFLSSRIHHLTYQNCSHSNENCFGKSRKKTKIKQKMSWSTECLNFIVAKIEYSRWFWGKTKSGLQFQQNWMEKSSNWMHYLVRHVAVVHLFYYFMFSFLCYIFDPITFAHYFLSINYYHNEIYTEIFYLCRSTSGLTRYIYALVAIWKPQRAKNRPQNLISILIGRSPIHPNTDTHFVVCLSALFLVCLGTNRGNFFGFRLWAFFLATILCITTQMLADNTNRRAHFISNYIVIWITRQNFHCSLLSPLVLLLSSWRLHLSHFITHFHLIRVLQFY